MADIWQMHTPSSILLNLEYLHDRKEVMAITLCFNTFDVWIRSSDCPTIAVPKQD